jgi:hypothetical protein
LRSREFTLDTGFAFTQSTFMDASLPPPLPNLPRVAWSTTTWEGGLVYQALSSDRDVLGQLLRNGNHWLVQVHGEEVVAIADLHMAAIELGVAIERKRDRVVARLKQAAGVGGGGWSGRRVAELRRGGRL